jgi:hypothetical protein
MGCPMEGCAKWVTDLRGHCAGTHPRGFPGLGSHGGGIWEGQGVCISDDHESAVGSGGDLFGYAAGLLSAIGCLEGHSVKPIEMAAMMEVCRVGDGRFHRNSP